MTPATKKYEDYHVAIICAIEFEMSAARFMLDEEHARLSSKERDSNEYILGKQGEHNVVIAYLPETQGKSTAAVVATNLNRTFPSIRWRFMTGIGGGVPSIKHDIRLGDVVVSMPDGTHGGVVQYDLGKDTDTGFKVKGFLEAPSARMRNSVSKMRSDHRRQDNMIDEFVSTMLQRLRRPGEYKRPPPASDILYDAAYKHNENKPTCDECDESFILARAAREHDGPEIHYGLIASGDRVMKSAVLRDEAVQELGDILCFEMEAAGLATAYPCIVVRGISDYADSHKNDAWQHYAAAAAAACTKELLTYLEPVEKAPEMPAEKMAPANNRKRKGDDHQVGFVRSKFNGRGINNVGGDFSVGGSVSIS